MAGVICAERWGKRPRVSARNRVKATAAEGVAAEHTPNCQRCAIKDPVPAHRGYRIFRTCGLKTACTRRTADGMEQRGDPTAVEVSHPPAAFCLRQPFAERFGQWQRFWKLPLAVQQTRQSAPFAAGGGPRLRRASGKPRSGAPLRACAV